MIEVDIDSRDEGFFVIDSETTNTMDTSVILDMSAVFVNMAKIHELHLQYQKDKPLKPLPFEHFVQLPYISKFTMFPDINEQISLGATVDNEVLRFWKKQKEETDNSGYKEYIAKLFTTLGKDDVRTCIDKFEYFLSTCFNEVPHSTQSFKQVFILERSGGFDSNKYYNMVYNLGLGVDFSRMKYYSRREIRTLISSNRWRIPRGVLQPNTTNWNGGVKDMISNAMGGEFIPHVAINDCLIDAYMIYLLKIEIDNFYL